MRTLSQIVLVIGVSIFIVGIAQAGGDVHWSYQGKTGPDHWGELSDAFSACSEGRNQSPINLELFIDADLPALGFDYQNQVTKILNNGHTVQVNFASGGMLKVDGKSFELKQVHFHSPSENQIEGKSFPMEAHFVHADSSGNLAVVALMFEQGKENAVLAPLWESIPAHQGDEHSLKLQINPVDLFPKNQDYYRFNGSLTTPPCSEGVRWLVLKESVSLSKAQLKAFTGVLHEPNNRPILPQNARPVLR